jgi:hypothetical protein
MRASFLPEIYLSIYHFYLSIAASPSAVAFSATVVKPNNLILSYTGGARDDNDLLAAPVVQVASAPVPRTSVIASRYFTRAVLAGSTFSASDISSRASPPCPG